ncbi:uncharacterized protein LOC116852516 isoform X2 [Odontomachus brunneus]|uniref:uncharacterized protein LOC116852516 isoform X2 n=1 Tax=Odontomachus brunneus TaxID=486640 RepID=UPI0013F20080|nr:uncharacterized protein LOC116852516 isoform X2 [Odontomachus brunneus]
MNEPMKAINDKVSPERSAQKEIVMNYGKSPADTGNGNITDVPGVLQHTDLHAFENLCQPSLNTDGSTNITWTITENFVKVQEEIRVKLEHVEVKLYRILNKLFPEEIKLNKPHGIPAFPLRKEEEWEQMEEILTNNNAFIRGNRVLHF